MHIAGLEMTSISLTGGEKRIKFSASSLSNCLKWLQKALIILCLLFLGLFLNDSRWVPLETNASTLNLNNNSFLGTLFIGTFEFILFLFY